MLVSRVICQTNWNTRVYVVFQSIISHGWQATGSQSPLLILLQCRQGNMRLGGGIQYSEFSNGVRYVLWGCVVGDNTGLGTHLTWTMHTSHARCYKASEWVGGTSSGAVIGDLVDAAAWGIVPCVSKIYSCV